MNKKKLMELLESKKGGVYRFTFNGLRNQSENFEGKIIDIYPSIFLVQTFDVNPRIRSFSYSDLITSNLEISDK